MGTSLLQRGFTIIETTLVISIAAILAMAILVGSGLAISQQRYRDSLVTFQTLVQEQYALASNVVNGRAGNEGCSAQATELPDSGATNVPRGQSDCVIIGRYLKVENGTNITTTNVLARRTVSPTPANNDIADIQANYSLAASTSQRTEDTVAWGNALFAPLPALSETNLAILIVRSPTSGATMTFSRTAVPGDVDIKSLVTPANTAERRVCIDPQGAPIQGTMLGIRIAENAASQAAVSIMTDTEAKGVCYS